jgi:hypothetical protein
MLKYILIAICVGYILRRFFITPIPGSKAYEEHIIKQHEKIKKSKSENIDYTDYEEIK